MEGLSSYLQNMTKLPNQDLPLHGPTNAAGDGQVVTEARAKQGLRGRHMMIVLAISVVLAAGAMFGLWALNAGALGSAARTGHGVVKTQTTT
jgi:hypothetical protein